MKVLVVVPTRLGSTRLPNKPLYKIKGREMILRVMDRLKGFESIVATPDGEIAELVLANGYDVFLTQEKAECGTDRLVELAKSIKADIYVNVQGDEPLIATETINKIVQAKISNPDKVVCGMTYLDSSTDCVKVLVTREKPALSRKLYKQVGIYAFNEMDLQEFGQLGGSTEDIEITRYPSERLLFVEVEESQDVNVLADIKKVESML